MGEISVLGGGSWGTALACHLAGQGKIVQLLFRRPEMAERVARTRENETYLPGYALPRTVRVTADPRVALEGATLVLVVTPARGIDRAAGWLKTIGSARPAIVSCTKGIRADSLETPKRTLSKALPGLADRMAVLSGPTFARDLARGDPSAAVVAAADPALAREVQSAVSGGSLRLYTNPDPRGVELAGALKNVIAIAAGVVDGLGYGSNTTAALITRGLAEIMRLGTALGGQAATFMGLAGLGDLVLTCTGALSRNRGVGLELGRGRLLEEIVGETRMVAEGIATAGAARRLANREHVDMPIVEQVAAILFEGRRPADALAVLLARGLKAEAHHRGGKGTGHRPPVC
ncbi:MAG: NAD(P)H-dependent glycerol-3-phosphate dehydrogenase [Acidobacteriota bacterium]